MKALARLAVFVLLAIYEAASYDIEVSFERSEYSALEGGPFEVCLVARFGPLTNDANVTLERTYEVGTVQALDIISIPAGFTEGNVTCVEFMAVNNFRLDSGNTITVKIMSATTGVEISSDCYTLVQVVDDEIVEIGFSESSYTVDEDAGSVTICLEITEAEDETRRPIDVIVYTAPHFDSPVSFETLRRIVTIPIGSVEGSTSCFDVVIIDDEAFTNDTYFKVQAEEEDLNVRFGFSSNSDCVVVTVVDDEEPCPLEFIGDTPSVNGNNITVSLPPCAENAMCEIVGEGISGLCSGGLTLDTTSRETLRVTLGNGVPVELERELRADNPQCDAHEINSGAIFNDNGTVTFQFEGTGPDAAATTTAFRCSIDSRSAPGFVDCDTPFTTDVLDSGDHTFRVRFDDIAAAGCDRRRTRRVDFFIP